MNARRIALVLLCAAPTTAGCGGDVPRLEHISRSIAASDSLRRKPLPTRDLLRPRDLPTAATADSDSVDWVPIQTEPVPPKGPPTM